MKASPNLTWKQATRLRSRKNGVTGHNHVRAIAVPLSLLVSKELTPAAKLLWIRLRYDGIHRSKRSHRPRQLAKRTCLGRSTVYEALRRGEVNGWFVRSRDPETGKPRWKAVWPQRGGDRAVRIPVALIRAAHELRPVAILCYGILQAVKEFNVGSQAGTFKWGELKQISGLDLRTIRRAVRALAAKRWIATAQKHRLQRIWFRLMIADEAYLEEIRVRLERAEFAGEALMRSYLSLIVQSDESEDWARPEFLVNPASGERMELDRYYPVHRVAFEFNGRQHYQATGQFPRPEVEAQRKRDQLKRQICREKNIELVVVHAEDLSVIGMLKKVGNLLPRRALRGLKRTIEYLDNCSLRYRQAAARG